MITRCSRQNHGQQQARRIPGALCLPPSTSRHGGGIYRTSYSCFERMITPVKKCRVGLPACPEALSRMEGAGRHTPLLECVARCGKRWEFIRHCASSPPKLPRRIGVGDLLSRRRTFGRNSPSPPLSTKRRRRPVVVPLGRTWSRADQCVDKRKTVSGSTTQKSHKCKWCSGPDCVLHHVVASSGISFECRI